jgi:uncharacterized membrane protein
MMNMISRHLREREIRQRILQNRIRNAVTGRLPALLPEFLRMLAGSLIGFGVIAELLRHFSDVNPVYVLLALNLLFSIQVTHLKYRLSVDPDYRIPGCGCTGAANDKTDAVLRSRESAVLGIPNSVLAVGLYSAMFLAVHFHHDLAAIGLAILAVLGSGYLGYVMVVRIASLCPICINIAALNVLILLQFVR